MTEKDILTLLSGVVHPESGTDIVSLGLVENLTVTPDVVRFTLNFPKRRDPFALSIKKQAEQLIAKNYPQYREKIHVLMKEKSPKPAEPKVKRSFTGGIRHVIGISSAKGGVGKSTVTANLAAMLARMGYRVGVLDADIYGPSQPTLFGLEQYKPEAEQVDGTDRIIPAECYGVKVMSIGFFIEPADALIWRGPMATNALRQMIHQTAWGELDFLLVDLPPGTGDVHLTVLHELKFTAAVIVSTPQQVALADVIRGIRMFRSESLNIPILGLIENMAWFTPAELPENRYYIFGKEGVKNLAERENLPLLGEIPLVQSVRESSDRGEPAALTDGIESRFYAVLANHILEQTNHLPK